MVVGRFAARLWEIDRLPRSRGNSDRIGTELDWPQLGDKPYTTLEMDCRARVKGEYYLFLANDPPTEHHRIERLTKQ